MVCLVFFFACLATGPACEWSGREKNGRRCHGVGVCVRVHRGVPRGQRGIRVTARRGAASEDLRGFTRLAAGNSKK